MRFANQVYLYFLILLPVLAVFLMAAWRMKKKQIAEFGDPELMEKLTGSVSREKQKLKMVLVTIAFFFLVLALSGPQIGTKMVDIKRKGVDVIIAVDCSTSMLAQDMKPDRLTKAKMELSSIIDRMNGDRVGIIAFSGIAFLQCPLTLDYSAAKMFLNIIDCNLIPVPGTSLDSAVKLAIESFSRTERKYKALIVLTDGENHDKNLMPVVDEAKKEGLRIYTIGVGSVEGEPIPVTDESGNLAGYKKDRQGAVIMSKLDESTLREISLRTGGKYYRATPKEFEIENIYDDILKMDKKDLQSRLASQYEDRFQYFVFIVLLLAAAEFFITETKASLS